MTTRHEPSIIPGERIVQKIFSLRGENVLLDVHLAELYGVETRTLKQAVKRNMERFPPDFMFELHIKEVNALVAELVIPHKKFFGGSKPYAFTETGVAMLSSVLKSESAVEINIAIMRTFVALRRTKLSHKEIMQKLEEMKEYNDEKFKGIFAVLDYLLNPPKTSIGFNGISPNDSSI